MRVTLTYFRSYGALYTCGEYETTKTRMADIFQEVADMARRGIHPGLVDHVGPYYILVEPESDRGYPALIIPDAWRPAPIPQA